MQAGAYQRIGESTEVALRVLAEKVGCPSNQLPPELVCDVGNMPACHRTLSVAATFLLLAATLLHQQHVESIPLGCHDTVSNSATLTIPVTAAVAAADRAAGVRQHAAGAGGAGPRRAGDVLQRLLGEDAAADEHPGVYAGPEDDEHADGWAPGRRAVPQGSRPLLLLFAAALFGTMSRSASWLRWACMCARHLMISAALST